MLASNEMQQMKPALTSDAAGFAADLTGKPDVLTRRTIGSKNDHVRG